MNKLKDVAVPDIGDFHDVEVIEVHVADGDHVNKEDPLISLESDKATLDIPSTENGVVTKLMVKVGDKVSEGSNILSLEIDQKSAAEPADESSSSDTAQDAPESVIEAAPREAEQSWVANAKDDSASMQFAPPSTLPPPVEKSGGAVPHASPGIRRFARELGADLSQIRGSGAKGRILKEDVRGYVKQALSQPGQVTTGAPALPSVPDIDFSKFGPTETQPLGRIKKLSGNHLHAAWLNIPHVTHHDEADVTALETFRQELKTQAEAKGIRVTMLAFIVKAVANAIREFPQFNASLSSDRENLILKNYFNIGIAVDTPHGLVVPVLRDVEKKGIWQLAEDMSDISLRAREGKLKPDDLQGGCISISSLGGIGGTAFTPVINAPEVAILGVSKSDYKPVWNGKKFQPRLMLPLDLSYDHRVIDGAEAARFAVYLTQVLADAVRLAL